MGFSSAYGYGEQFGTLLNETQLKCNTDLLFSFAPYLYFFFVSVKQNLKAWQPFFCNFNCLCLDLQAGKRKMPEILESYFCILSGRLIGISISYTCRSLFLDYWTFIPISFRPIFSLLDRTIIFPQNSFSFAVRDFICSWFKLVGQWFAWNYILMVY